MPVIDPVTGEEIRLSRTKLFLLMFFAPAWFASLMSWGDERTSENFNAAPHWFYQLQIAVQLLAILIVFIPPALKKRPSLFGLFCSSLVMISLYFTKPVIEAEYVLISGSTLIALVAIFLSLARADAAFDESDIAFLFYLFVAGFMLQLILFMSFGVMPSHSNEDLFIRFNGITNDSLASGFILSMFVPWAVTSRFRTIKMLLLVAGATATGSLFSALFVPAAVLVYLIYARLYRYFFIIVAAMLGGFLYFIDTISRIMDLKIDSMLVHLRFFLNLAGSNYRQSTISCSREFCESFLESGSNLSSVYLVAFFALLACFFLPLFRRREPGEPRVVRDSLRVYAIALIAAAFVHPIPLVPYAVPLALILCSLCSGRTENVTDNSSLWRHQSFALRVKGGAALFGRA